MKRRISIIITLLVFAVCAVSLARRVWAQDAVEKRFDQLDKNSDGKITAAELPAAEFFKRLDLDGNGEITKAEAATPISTRLKTSFASASLNPLMVFLFPSLSVSSRSLVSVSNERLGIAGGQFPVEQVLPETCVML